MGKSSTGSGGDLEVGNAENKSTVINSNWGCVTNGVPQGSAQGRATALLSFISDVDTGISGDITDYADDIKIGRIIKSDKDAKVLEDELDRLYN